MLGPAWGGTLLRLTVVGRPVGGRVPTEVQHAVQGVRLHRGLDQVAQELGVAAARRLVQRGPSLRVPAQSGGPVLQQRAHTALTAHDGLPGGTQRHARGIEGLMAPAEISVLNMHAVINRLIPGAFSIK